MKNKTLLATTIVSILAANTAFANDTTELKTVITNQQQSLAALERRLAETEQRLEATASHIDSTSQGLFANTSLGGYGEVHYNNYEDKDAKVDFHRYVLFIGHEFTDKVRFFSEFELEHSIAGDGKPGEIELEQAYVEVDVSDSLTTKTGLFLIPVGIINETHEPPTFYGVERNAVEKNIIPATWWEAGAAINYQLAPGVSLDAAITSGLNVAKGNKEDGYSLNKIRSGRQKVGNAVANSLAYTGRIKYTAIAGLELAATLQYQEDIAQDHDNLATASATLFEGHAIYNLNDFSVRALYARWDISGDDAKAQGVDEQSGWYIEPSYKVNEKVGVFARLSSYDIKAGDSKDSEVESVSFGANYYLHENVVLKADFESLGGSADGKGFNLGFGYNF